MAHAISRTPGHLFVGSDTELGMVFPGAASPADHGGAAHAAVREAARLYGGVSRRAGYNLRRTDRLSADGPEEARTAEPDGEEADPQDQGRVFLPNGSCIYVDLGHVEAATAECPDAFTHLTCFQAGLRIAGEALQAHNARRAPAPPIALIANNSDGFGSSWGGHTNLCISRGAFDELFLRRGLALHWLASFTASSVCWSGAGKLWSESGLPRTPYRLSQRGDFFEALVGWQTTANRPLVNCRDEPLCGARGARWADAAAPARLHHIFFDTTLLHAPTLLRTGVLQLVCALLEDGLVDPALVLESPLDALALWDADPRLRAAAPLDLGGTVTAAEHQLLFRDAVADAIDKGGLAASAPRAKEVLGLWSQILESLHARDLQAAAPRVQWIHKLGALRRAKQRRPGLDGLQLKVLDVQYANLDPGAGLYWAYEAAGALETWATEDEIARRVHAPPEDSRAWTRGALVRRARNLIDDLDWDFVTLREEGGFPRRIALERLDGFGRPETGDLLGEVRDFDLEAVAEGLETLGRRDRAVL